MCSSTISALFAALSDCWEETCPLGPSQTPWAMVDPGTLSRNAGGGRFKDRSTVPGQPCPGSATCLEKMPPGTLTPILSHSASIYFPTQGSTLTLPSNSSSRT